MPNEKKHRCYNCKKEFYVSRNKGRIIILSIVCIILVIFNLILLYSSKKADIHIMIITDAVCILASILLFPFTVRFKPIKLTKSEKRRKTSAGDPQ